MILGIETSCDETAAAVAGADAAVLAEVVRSQVETHARFGGVVPELAGRRHIESIDEVVREALARAGVGVRDLGAVAVTGGPGLIGALLVGVSYGKALAYSLGIPLIPVNHLEGHLSAAWLGAARLAPPFVALVASGGHTNLYHVKERGEPALLGRTLDDAAGEAFDKAAKMLGLGYPGGPVIDRLAREGDPDKAPFPRPYPTCEDLNFSFSGIKTALLYHLRDREAAGRSWHVPDVAAGFQQAIVEVLVAKTLAAAGRAGVRDVVVTGGVAANSQLRALFEARGKDAGITVHIPPLRYCTDNGAMIAAAGARLLQDGRAATLAFEPRADWAIGD
ncbi:MAG: tRNA (adenosine(37)-N6)-threonylcarbamoyltransferase complex transferase subunit TsaD [Nitrospirae bacterium]|nr:MAG: tRNA (adenosine(37)-N6)-threonylcarbamoyltransferase complex transferase subunit TsaD [Nitrospirota bacterium]